MLRACAAFPLLLLDTGATFDCLLGGVYLLRRPIIVADWRCYCRSGGIPSRHTDGTVIIVSLSDTNLAQLFNLPDPVAISLRCTCRDPGTQRRGVLTFVLRGIEGVV